MSIVDSVLGPRWNKASPIMGPGLLLRKIQVFCAAASVFVDYKICQWRCNQIDVPNSDVMIDDIWNRTHERNARYLCDSFISLEGLWVKLGQYLSSRADVMPDPYLKALAKCQVL